ncbi:hypothetical protein JCM19232_2644 [Vibrio ishigakensis]|uniref:Uncharacterized protein n=1 Tax=Vibrio ishigakensis TaxID=1481914 RepID=A0A0B8PLT7_9VIBR|nr:hypothetical protein JCM19232_2644 [Vibrio ishigakensis]
MLPYSGGVFEQPNPYIRAMEIIGTHLETRDDGKTARK